MSARRVFAAAVLALLVACPRHAAQAQAPGAAPEPPAAAKPPAPDGKPEPRRGDASRGRPDMPMSPEMVDRIIEVARDVSPDLARQIEERRNASPEEMTQAVRQSARRLVSLAVLKQRNPELYAIRVEDLRLQLELRALGEQYRAAVEAKDDARAKSLDAQIAAKARAQFDVDVRARAQELVALDQQVKTMREELVQEQREADAKVAERAEATKKGLPIKQRGGMFMGGGEDRGEGDRRGGARPQGAAPQPPRQGDAPAGTTPAPAPTAPAQPRG